MKTIKFEKRNILDIGNEMSKKQITKFNLKKSTKFLENSMLFWAATMQGYILHSNVFECVSLKRNKKRT